MITYVVNETGAMAPSPTVIAQGEETRGSGLTTMVFGRNFQGWSSDSSAATVEYLAGNSYTFTESVTLYAVYGEAIDLDNVSNGSVWEEYNSAPMGRWFRLTTSEVGWYNLSVETIYTGTQGGTTATSGTGEGLYIKDSTGKYIHQSGIQYTNGRKQLIAELQTGTEYYLFVYVTGGTSASMGSRLTIQNLSSSTPKEEIHLPANLQAIEADAFSGTGVEYVFIPANTESVQAGAFAGCGSLKQITFESPETKIEEGAFDIDNMNLVISGPIPSSAYDYAMQYGYQFEELV